MAVVGEKLVPRKVSSDQLSQPTFLLGPGSISPSEGGIISSDSCKIRHSSFEYKLWIKHYIVQAV